MMLVCKSWLINMANLLLNAIKDDIMPSKENVGSPEVSTFRRALLRFPAISGKAGLGVFYHKSRPFCKRQDGGFLLCQKGVARMS
jgi:hypothetical protein